VSPFTPQVAASDAILLAQYGETLDYQPAQAAQYPLVAVIDRSEVTRAALRVWATAWSLRDRFESEPARGDSVILADATRLRVSDVKIDEFSGRLLYLVIAP